jgi:nucleoside-diphosphate-sugar epimerase
MFQRAEGWPIVGVMPFQTYGPGQPARTVLGAALRAAQAGENFPATSGEQARDWIYIDDVVEGILASARAENIEGETIELGTGVGTPVREVVTRLFEFVGQGRPLIGALPQRPGEVAEQIANAARTEQLIGWRAKVGIEAGLKKMMEHE